MSGDAPVRPKPRSTIARLVGSITLVVGGLLISAWPLISNRTPGGYIAIVLLQFVGFSLLLAGVVLISTRSTLVGRIALIAAAALALFGWSWFLHVGLIVEIPIWVWSSAGAALFLCAGVAYAISAQMGLSFASLLFVAGYVGTTVIAFHSPVAPPPYTDIPTGIAAIAAGVLTLALSRTASSN